MHISTLLRSKRSFHAQKANLCENQPFLVDCNGMELQARPLSESDLSEGPNRSVTLPAVIDALALYAVPHKDTQGIAALAGGIIHFVEMGSAGFFIRSRLPLATAKGQTRPLEGGPRMQVASNDKRQVLVLHAISGFLTLIELNGLFSPKRQKHLHRTFSIGSIVVVGLAVSSSVQDTLALLYRDIDFNYSLRYYRLGSHTDTLPLLSQKELFSGTPSHVTAAPGGFFVFSDMKVWFFPDDGTRVTLGEEANATLSSSPKHNVVTKNVAGPIGSRVTCAAHIDPCRLLFITDTGSTHMLYMRTQGNRLNVQVDDLQVLDLGKSTIASNLVHVGANVFYAGSSISRSIVFQVLPTRPHIHVARVLTNSPPVLDVGVGVDAYMQDLWICRGGFHNGEVQRYAGTSLGLVPLATAAAPPASDVRFSSAESMSLFENGECVGAFTADSHMDPIPAAPLPPRYPGQRSWQVGSSPLVLEDGVFSYAGISVPTHLAEITDVAPYVQDEVLHVLCASWDGALTRISFGPEPTTSSVATGGKGHCTVCRTAQDFVVAVDGSGHVYASRGFGGESRQIGASTSESGFRVVGGEHVVICSSSSIYHLESGSFSQPKRIYSSRRPIKSCDLHGNKVVILFQDNTLAFFRLEEIEAEKNAYLSDKLILKTVIMQKWVVALAVEITVDTQARTPQRNPSLLVLEADTLQAVSHVTACRGLVDICVMEAGGEPLLVGARSVCSPHEYLQTFRMKKGKLHEKSVPINGFLPAKSTIARISACGSKVCLVGSAVLEFKLIHRNNTDPADLAWSGKVIESKEAFFFVDVALSDQEMVLADVNRGLFGRKKDGPVEKLFLEYSPVYPTAVALLDDSSLVYGDSWGNLGVVDGSRETMLAANIGEQINAITVAAERPLHIVVATVSGGIYSVTDSSDGEPLTEKWRGR